VTSSDRAAGTTRSPQQRLLRVTVGASIPSSWKFVQWVGKETDPITGHWQDVVLCEFIEDDE
jgi:hypothetical protein